MERLAKAIFAGGCFWCLVHPFEELEGVAKVTAGYTGGRQAGPTYDDYARKGHLEAVEITYDPSKITYPELLDIFWKQIDPTDAQGQFCDRGRHYSTAIFYQDQEQKRQALDSKKKLEQEGRFSRPLATRIVQASEFYPAEEYHQDYHKKNPLRYALYRQACGRDRYLQDIWRQDGQKRKAEG